ncbi:MAG: carbohydrate ABC transporter permease [Hungatella hathewayi]|uniref:carbohydrate ABC transporter permease n=1 Tax=Hungatella TaxID=1649459 RepID=UPI0014860B14|nr:MULTISPECIES: carbohydrate ABC transporter permease [Hungatella]MCI7380733.1 carbohydrate ABC transporter permease [Hungatella sp.]MDY6235727.1 carbohydrate ABC transporter permease [Hungatella hathewayi]
MRESTKDRAFQSSITFILLILGVIALVPLLTVIARSFSSKAASDMNIVNLWPVGFTLDSWKYILSDSGLWRAFFITLVSTVAGTALALLVTSLMAYPLSKENFKLGHILMLYVIITMIFKAPVVPYFLTVKGMGLFNNPLVLVLPHILSAYNLAIMRTFFKQFPAEVEEAAMIDGCGYFRILYKIIIPSSKAVLTTVGLFYAVTIWNQFQHPLMFIQKTDLFPLQLKIRQLINGGSDIANITAVANVNYTESTLSAATVVFAIIPIIAVYPWLQKYFAKGAMLGSVKG